MAKAIAIHEIVFPNITIAPGQEFDIDEATMKVLSTDAYRLQEAVKTDLSKVKGKAKSKPELTGGHAVPPADQSETDLM